MERSTTELLLPDAKAKVILYSFLVSGDFRKIQAKLLENVKFKLDEVESNPEDIKEKEMGADIVITDQNFTAEVLIKEVSLQDGTKVNNIPDFVYNLSIADGQMLFQKVSEISQASRLSESDKKK